MSDNQLAPLSSKATGRLTPIKKERIEVVTRSIDALKGDAKRITEVSRRELEEVAESYARAPSTVLAGVVGGALGAAGGIGIGTFAGTVLIVSGPVGLAVGAALGVLAFRGRNYWRLERATQKTRGAIDLVKAEIATLPPNAPAELRRELYSQYESLLCAYTRIACESIDDGPPRPGI